jgi:hypothetical protein
MFPNLLTFRRTILTAGIGMHQSYIANALLLRATVNGGTICWVTRSPEEGVQYLRAFGDYEKAAGNPTVANLRLVNAYNYHLTATAYDLQNKIASLTSGVQRPLIVVLDSSRDQAALLNSDRWHGWIDAITSNLACQSLTVLHSGHLPNPEPLQTRLADCILRVEDDQPKQLGAIPVEHVGLRLKIVETKPGRDVSHLKGTTINSTVVFDQVPEAKPLVRPSTERISYV